LPSSSASSEEALSAGSSPHDAAARSHRNGVLLCLASAAGFGAMAIFAKVAFNHGATVTGLLTLRFGIAAAVLWVIVAVARRPLPAQRGAVAGIGLGAFGYSAQAACYFSALRHIDASLTALLLYTFPVLVFVGAVLLGRDRATRVRVAALGLALAGVGLVLVGGSPGALNATGVALALGAALTYTVYILVADTVVGDADSFSLAAIVATGAAAALLVFAATTGRLELQIDASGWAAISALALVSTVGAISAFFLGLTRVGPSTASIVSTLEPVVTVALAALIFSERLGPVQLAGGGLVLMAVVVLQLRPQSWARPAAPDHAAPAG
jgi:drug/metabolite transporter (DMT)-like permease